MLGMGVRGICVLGALLWGGAAAAHAQAAPAPTALDFGGPACAGQGDGTAPRKVRAPEARGSARSRLEPSAARKGTPFITHEPDRVVELWTRPGAASATAGTIAGGCGRARRSAAAPRVPSALVD